MSYSRKEGVFFSTTGVVASADAKADAIEVRDCSSGAVFVTWSAAAATDAVVKLQESPTGGKPDAEWDDISGATATISAAAGQKKIAVANCDAPYLRAVLTKNSESTAVVVPRYYFKGAR